ncbi:hypothetical protein MNB_SUP05-SYMBIONT-7-109 [hydrothermal vent metagenome]|uniref:Response regulator VCA0850 n=1 Tax=hydrothermal vent metagenome TaxID=652676 RepID=A0A1W1E579_9ZZZZ
MDKDNKKSFIIIATLIFNTLIALLLSMTMKQVPIGVLLFISHSIGLSIMASNLLIVGGQYTQSIGKIVGYGLTGFVVGTVIAFGGVPILFGFELDYSLVMIGLFFGVIGLVLAWLYLNGLESQEALDKIKQKLSGSNTKKLLWIKASDAKGVVFLVHTKDIKYFQSQDKYTNIYTQDGEYLINTSIKQLLKQLDKDYFWGIHRSTIVNLKFISKVSKNEADKLMVYLEDETALSVSRNYASLFKKM